MRDTFLDALRGALFAAIGASATACGAQEKTGADGRDRARADRAAGDGAESSQRRAAGPSPL
jgi:hypothetical protein